MTTYQGIAAATQTLRHLVDRTVHHLVPEAVTTLDSPARQGTVGRDEPRVGIYLLHVRPDPLFRTADLPTRTPAGLVTTPPVAAVGLRYLLTFSGPPTTSHLLLGAVEVALRESAVLDAGLVRSALSGHPHLALSAFDRQDPPAALRAESIGVEEMSRIWSGFFQIPYALSTIVEVSPVLLQSATPVRAHAVPVRIVGVRPGGRPVTLFPFAPVTWTPDLTVPVSGEGLTDRTDLLLDDTPVPLFRTTPSTWSFRYPTTAPAGRRTVSVAGTSTHTGLEVRPQVGTVDLESDRVTVEVRPVPGEAQTVCLEVVSDEGDGVTRAWRLTKSRMVGDRVEFLLPKSQTVAPVLGVLSVDGVDALAVPLAPARSPDPTRTARS